MEEKLAIVLACGGMYGAYSAASLKGLAPVLEEEEVSVAKIYAFSAGAWTTPYFVSGQLGEMEMVWHHRTGGRQLFDFFNIPRLRPALKLRHMIGVLRTGELRLNFPAVFRSPTTLEIVLTNLDTGRARYVAVQGEARLFFRRLCASAAVPVLHPPIYVDGAWHIDGGLSDPFPVERALQDGHKKVIVIVSKPRGIYGDRYTSLGKLFLPFLQRSIAPLVRTYEKRLETIDKKIVGDPRVFILRPTTLLPTKSFADSDVRHITQTFEQARRELMDITPCLRTWLHV